MRHLIDPEYESVQTPLYVHDDSESMLNHFRDKEE